MENRVKQLELDFHFGRFVEFIHIIYGISLANHTFILITKQNIWKYDKSIQNSDSNKSKKLSKGKENEVKNKMIEKLKKIELSKNEAIEKKHKKY